MGFYDANCAISSVCLGFGKAVLVPLRRLEPGRYRPFALPMKGQYDRLGAVDLTDSANTAAIVTFFDGLAKDREFVRREGETMGGSIEAVVSLIEENTTVWLSDIVTGAGGIVDGPMVAVDGVPLVHALISREVWEAIAAAGADKVAQVPAEVLLAELDDDLLTEIYAARLPEVDAELRELVAVDRFLRARGLRWKTHTEGEVDFGAQQSIEDLQWWLDWAYQHHGDDPVLRAGLDAHAVDVERLRAEDEQEAAWLEDQAAAAAAAGPSPSAEEMLAALDAMVVKSAVRLEPGEDPQAAGRE